MMASKRASHEEGNDDMDHQVPGKRRHGNSDQAETRTTAISNSMPEQWRNEIASLFRRVIREEVPPILQRHLSPCFGLSLNRERGTSGGRVWQLCFMNKLPRIIYTLSKIIAEDGAPLQIELRDATYQHRIVKEEGSSMKIQVCVLNGNFGSNGSENWTAEEFNAQTVSPREGKGPLLIGDTVITLKDGVGYISKNVVFTDNSRCTSRGTFRLGVKIVQPTLVGADIREGRSEPFKVLDKRGEAHKKHEFPSLNDEVWRLKKIIKGGKTHKQLSSNGIETVKDLLQLYTTNQASLKEIIGYIKRKSWDTIIEHAKTCDKDDDKRYIYHCFVAEQSVSLVFNCIYEVVEVSFNGQNFHSLETLNLDEKGLVERVKQQAYMNVKGLMPLETTTHGLVKPLAGVQAVQNGAADQALQQFDFPIAQQGQPETGPNLCEPSTSTSHIDQLGSDKLPEFEEMQQNWLEFMTAAYNDGNEWPLSGSHIDQSASYFSLPTPAWEQDNFLYPPNGDGIGSSNHSYFPNSNVYISSKGKRKTVWCKIRNALKWVILHLHLSNKRKAKLVHRHY